MVAVNVGVRPRKADLKSLKPSKPESDQVRLPFVFWSLFGVWSQQQAGHLIALPQNSHFGFADFPGDGATSPGHSVIQRTVVDVSRPNYAGSIGITNHDADITNLARTAQASSLSNGGWFADRHAWDAYLCTG